MLYTNIEMEVRNMHLAHIFLRLSLAATLFHPLFQASLCKQCHLQYKSHIKDEAM
jgi:hypothetical protein